MEDVFGVSDAMDDEQLKEGKHLCMLLNKDANVMRLIRVVQEYFVVHLSVDGENRYGILAGLYRQPQEDFESVDAVALKHWQTGELPDGH